MPNEALPNKREVMLALLAETSVFVHLDPRSPSVRVPPWFKNQPQLVLQIGLNMAVQIPDLDVSEQGISCTLSFSRRPFFCSIPWNAVFGLVGDNGPGLVWPDDVPAEIAAQVQAQTQGQTQKTQAKKPAAREAARGRLRAVGSESAAETGGSSEPTRPAPAAAAAPVPPAPVPVAAPAHVLSPVPKAVPVAASQDQTSPPEDQPAGDKSEEAAAEAPKVEVSRKPVASSRSGSKRELPSYLRVVK
jgi:hypothetical protein